MRACAYACVCWCMSYIFKGSSLLPFILTLPEITHLHKSIIFSSEIAATAASNDKCSLYSFCFPPFSFIFFISCTCDTNTVRLIPLNAPRPHRYPPPVSCPPTAAAASHVNMSQCTPLHSVTNTDISSAWHYTPPLKRSKSHSREYKTRAHRWAVAMAKVIWHWIVSEIETRWSCCLQSRQASEREWVKERRREWGKKKSLSVPLFNPEPPAAFSSLSESLFLGLGSLLYPGTLRALCDCGDKETALTKVCKHIHGSAGHLESMATDKFNPRLFCRSGSTTILCPLLVKSRNKKIPLL